MVSADLKMQKITNVVLRLLVIIALWAFAINVMAADFVWIKSDDGSPIADGGEAFYDPTNAALTVTRNARNGFDVSYTPIDNLTNYVINFSGPDMTEIVAGQYDGVQRFPFEEPGHPGVYYIGPGSCGGNEQGSFLVHEVVYLGDGSVDSLALDLTLYCGNSLRKSDIYIRINSNVPAGPVGPIAIAGADQIVLPNTDVTLDASNSYSTDAEAFTYQWQQIEGTPVNLTGVDQASPTFTTPPITSSYELLRFQITIIDTLNRQSTDTVTVAVSESLQSRTEMLIRTNTSDWLGRVVEESIDQSVIPWRIIRMGNNGIKISADCLNAPPNTTCSSHSDPPGFELWTADYSEPAIGSSDAGYSLSTFIDDATIRLNNGCAISHYHILDVAYKENGAVDRLAVNFYSDCQNGMQGFMRINSALPYMPNYPLVSAGRDRVYFSGETVTLAGTHTWDTNLPAVNYVWRQISGLAVTIDNPNSPVTSFTAPNVAMSDGDMVFELSVTNEQGQVRTDTVDIRILGDQDPRTYSYMYQSPSDYNNRWYISENDTAISATHMPYFSHGERLTVNFESVVGSRDVRNESHFMIPGGGPITPGLYYIDEIATPGNYGSGYIDTSPSAVCSPEKGQFIVHEIETDQAGQVTRLALDFSHYCEDYFQGPRTTYGVIRINSLVPRSFSSPVAVPSPDLYDFVGNTVILDASQSWNIGGEIVSYQWQQTSGVSVVLNDPNSMRATFTAPDVAVGAERIGFRLTVTDQFGNTSSRLIGVNVYPNSTTQTAAWYRERNQSVVITPDTSTSAVYSRKFYYSADEYSGIEISLGRSRLLVRPENRKVLGVGVYDDASEHFGTLDLHRPSFHEDFLQPYLCMMEVRRKFIVHEITYNPTSDNIDVLALDFELYCGTETTPIVEGGVRINSSIPMVNPIPAASAGRDKVVFSGEAVTLDAQSSRDKDGAIVSYQWSQVSGTPVTLVDANTSVANFVTPPISGTEETLTFYVTVTDNDGNSQSDNVSIRVVTEDTPRRLLRVFVGDSENPNLETPVYDLNENNSFMETYVSSLGNYINIYSDNHFWFHFVAPGDGPLTPGMYETNYGNMTNSRMEIEIDYADCYGPPGRFNVLEVSYDANGQLETLAVDFEQYCGIELVQSPGGIVVPAPTVYRGHIRFNSTWPIEAIELPTADAGPDPTMAISGNLSLDGSASRSTTSNIVSYYWQVGSADNINYINIQDSGQAVTDFSVSATDEAAPSQVEFELTVVNSKGFSDTDTVLITFNNVNNTASVNERDSVTTAAAPNNETSGGGANGIFFSLVLLSLFSIRLVNRHNTNTTKQQRLFIRYSFVD